MKLQSNDIIHTLLVDDHPLIRKGIYGVLSSLPYNLIVDEASSGSESIQRFGEKLYQLVFMDIQMKNMNGVEAAGIIKRKYPETKIIALTFLDDKRTMIEMLETGVDGYILKDIEIEDLSRAVKLVLDGGIYITPHVHEEWSKYLMDKARGSKKLFGEALSDREIEVMKLICHQKTSEEIAELLFLAVTTVNNHRANILRKTNSRNNIGLVLYAINQGYFNPLLA